MSVFDKPSAPLIVMSVDGWMGPEGNSRADARCIDDPEVQGPFVGTVRRMGKTVLISLLSWLFDNETGFKVTMQYACKNVTGLGKSGDLAVISAPHKPQYT